MSALHAGKFKNRHIYLLGLFKIKQIINLKTKGIMKKIFFPVLIALACVGCTGKSYKSAEEKNGAIKQDTLFSAIKTIDLDASGIIGVNRVMVKDKDTIFLSNSDAKGILYYKDGNRIVKGVSLGQGPDEVLGLNYIRFDDKGKLYSYDSNKGMVYFFTRSDSAVYIDSKEEMPRFLNDVIAYNKDFLVFPLLSKDYSIGLIKSDGDLIDSIAYWPPKPDGVSDKAHALASTGETAIMGDGHFARALLYDGGVDFYKIDGNHIIHINRFREFDMDYDMIDNQGVEIPIPNNESRKGFMKIKASRDNFYASFSNDKILSNSEAGAIEIFKFDKRGELKRKYIVNIPFTDFFVNENGDEIGCITTDEKGKDYIYIYKLPSN